jgi:coenzyme F420-0:L-glutamate ligase/coenzyme F420-1:gamma-L-glutamate ligase
MNTVQVLPIRGLPIIKKGDNLAQLIGSAAQKQGTPPKDGDIIVVTHVIVSKAEGHVLNLDEVVPSRFAETVAKKLGKDPALVEVILRESRSIRRMVCLRECGSRPVERFRRQNSCTIA